MYGTLVEISIAASAVGAVYGLSMLPLLLRPPVGPYLRPYLKRLLPWLSRAEVV